MFQVFEPVCILQTHIKEEKMDDDEVLDDDDVDQLMLREVVSRTHIASPTRHLKHSDSGLGSFPLGRSSQVRIRASATTITLVAAGGGGSLSDFNFRFSLGLGTATRLDRRQQLEPDVNVAVARREHRHLQP